MKNYRQYTPALVLTLLSVALLSVSAIIITNGLMPKGTTPAATPNHADWISAGGQAVGAVGTAGALLLGVWVYLRQEEDQRRAQAAAVSVGNTRKFPFVLAIGALRPVMYYLRNDSSLPIYNVVVYTLDGEEGDWDSIEVLPPGESVSFMMPSENYTSSGKFVDSAGRGWKRTSSGALTEIEKTDGLWTLD